MMKLLRRHRDWLMIVIAILAIPFVFYFVQRPDYGAIGRDQFAHIYDRNVSILEAQQMARLLSLAQTLGMSDFVGTMTAGAGMNQNQAAVQFIISLLVRLRPALCRTRSCRRCPAPGSSRAPGRARRRIDGRQRPPGWRRGSLAGPSPPPTPTQ